MLLQLAKRFRVVYQTLASGPAVTTIVVWAV
jgi:hypothetical protein